MKIKNILVAISLSVFLSNCSIDKIEPNNLLVEDNVVRDGESASLLLNSAYILFRTQGNSSGALEINHKIIYALNIAGEQFSAFPVGFAEDFITNTVEADDPDLQAIYINQYKVINTVNFLIEALEGGKASDLSDVETNAMIAEARTLRAIAHFRLLRIFGQFYDVNSTYGIVLRTEPARGAVFSERNTVQETYDAIVADLEYAVANGPSGIPHYRVSAITAQAYLAKAQLCMGDYTNAAITATAVINNSDGYTLEQTYEDIFFNRWDSSEVLFALYSGDGTITESATTPFLPAIYSPFFLPPSESFLTLADEQDGVPGDADPFTFSTGLDTRFSFGYNFTHPNNQNNPSIVGVPGNVKYPYGFDAPNGNTTYLLRLAEVYLIFAEAEARRSGGDLNAALARLNELRTRATGIELKTLSDKATLLEDIRNEKRLELYIENAEPWFDLVRYDILGDIDASTLKPTLTSQNKFIYPIPQSALASNNLLEQNPQ